jgi:hypothetical protein
MLMQEDIGRKHDQLAALCRRFGVEWLEVFGPAGVVRTSILRVAMRTSW